jgi:glycosidase
LQWYSDLYALRQAQPILSQGVIDVLSTASSSVLVFTRTQGERTVYVAINFAANTRTLNSAWLEDAEIIFSSEDDANLSEQVPGQSVWVWER